MNSPGIGSTGFAPSARARAEVGRLLFLLGVTIRPRSTEGNREATRRPLALSCFWREFDS